MKLLDLIKYYIWQRLDTEEWLLRIECVSNKAKRKELLMAARKISKITNGGMSVNQALEHFYNMMAYPGWIDIKIEELSKQIERRQH